MVMDSGSLRYADDLGDYWASTTDPSELYAYYLYFNSAIVFPSDSNNRWNGFTVQSKTSPKSSIYLTRGGLVSMPTGSLRSAGYTGYYWGVSAYPSELYAYNLNFNSVIVFPSYNVDRWFGFAVRYEARKAVFNREKMKLNL